MHTSNSLSLETLGPNYAVVVVELRFQLSSEKSPVQIWNRQQMFTQHAYSVVLYCTLNEAMMYILCTLYYIVLEARTYAFLVHFFGL